MKFTSAASILALAVTVSAGPCPFHQVRSVAESSGKLSARDIETFERMARDPTYLPRLEKKSNMPEKREPEPALLGGALGGLLGGGLIGGVLQPLTGALAGLELPTPQASGLEVIPGADPLHQFVAPGPTDVRGLCPTLNTLANHGYISRDGITTFAEAANAVQIGYGFGYDIAVGLSALGLIAGGDLISGKYSIGGADARVPNTLGPALGLDKHGTFEIDGSVSREDAYFGNQANFILDRFNALENLANTKYGGQFGRSLMVENQAETYASSRATNPTFNAGIKYLVVSNAERAFIYRALPNGTDPGNANLANIGPFFLNERFPRNWFRRASPYVLANVVTDVLDIFTAAPFTPGANEGLNNYVPLGTDIPTAPNAFGCFILENIFDTVPGFVQPYLLSNINLFEAFVSGVVAPFFTASFGCPALESYVAPSASAGTTSSGSQSSSGSPVNGVYQ